ncbi:PE domain-containing protein [Mycobacterium alsense]|uniref:PE domain-containing protein n=1 Tax=Mycobacterium alsense TaxID=324058 RepID=UPI0009EE8F97|nr:PE domain-containing protein [Mycobacterium alsense]
MSFVITAPDFIATAASDLANLGSALSAANAAATARTTAVVAAGADEVSAAVAAMFSQHAEQFQALNARAAAFHAGFAQALAGASGSYAAAEAAAVETPVWTFLGTRPANWWIRRRLHETAVHRADAALATGGEFTLDAHVAADAITEWLERVAIQAGSEGRPLPLADGDTLHLHADDPGLGEAGEWTIGVDGGAITWSHAHGKGSAALRGGATELLLAVAGRVRVADTGIALFGDDGVWQNWLDRTPF